MRSETDGCIESREFSVESLNAENADLVSAVRVVTCLSDDGFRQDLIQKGCASRLCNILLSTKNDDLIGNALEALSSLSRGSTSTQADILQSGALKLVLIAVSSESKNRTAALRLLNELADYPAVRSSVVDSAGVISLIKTLNEHQGDEVGKSIEKILEKFWRDDCYVAVQMASVGMFKPLICLLSPESPAHVRIQMAEAVTAWGVNPASRSALVESGAVPPLLDLLLVDDEEAMAASAFALEHLSHTESNRIAMAKEGVISGLVRARLRAVGSRVKDSAAATLANLAMDGQDLDLDSFDEDGGIQRLISALQAEESTSREYAVRTLSGMVLDSREVKERLVEEGGGVGIRAVFEMLLKEAGGSGAQLFSSSSFWSACVTLLGRISDEDDISRFLEVSEEEGESLLRLLERPISSEEKELLLSIIACMSRNAQSKSVLLSNLEQGNLDLEKYVLNSSLKSKENALWTLGRLAESSDLGMVALVGHSSEVLRECVKHLRLGPDSMRMPSLCLLGNLARSTDKLVAKLKVEKKTGGMLLSTFGLKKKSADKRKQCRIHNGKCSLESTFCLVEGEVLPWLLELIEKADGSLGEASLDAVMSLFQVENNSDLEKVVEYLVNEGIIASMSKQIGKNLSVTEKVVAVLELILRFPKNRTSKLCQPVSAALCRILATATGTCRKLAADAIQRLDSLPSGSSDSL